MRAGEVVPLFVLDPYFFAPERAQKLPRRIQFLLSSLAELQARIHELGSELVVVSGKSTEVVPRLAKSWKVERVVAHRWAEPVGRERDRRVAAALSVPLDLYEGETLVPPGTMRTGAGEPYSVFTPFARALRARLSLSKPLAAPRSLPPLPAGVTWKKAALPTLDSLGIEENPDVLAGGETAARARLRHFVRGPLANYASERDRMDHPGTSRLSADLKFGTLSVRTVWTAAEASEASDTFLNELVWREFAYSTLWDRPELLERPFRAAFESFPWENDASHWRAWVDGRTGYPVVDASARQLLGEGFVHNRARMISASFLTKHLLVDYRRGESHYLELLTDGDWANNNMGWQWSAGCGCDAQPWFRIFNPVTQGKKFDPDGEYVRRWVPELARMPARYIHSPWEAPRAVLDGAGVRLGRDYPHPVVDHREARDRFLALATEHLRSRS